MRTKSIQARFVVLVIAIVSVMLGAFAAFTYIDNKAQKSAELNTHLRSVKHRLMQSLPSVVWRFDREQIRQIVDAELGPPSIVGIAVYDEKDRLIYQAPHNITFPDVWTSTSALVTPTEDEFLQTFSLKMQDQFRTEAVGTVRIHASSANIEEALRTELLRLAVLVLLMNLALVAALSAVMRMVIMRPLNALRNALRDIAHEDADLTLRLPASAWSEYADVTNNFNAFVKRLQDALGAPIDEVHHTISRIAQGDFSQQVIKADTANANTVIAHLGVMQDALVALTSQLRQAKLDADCANQAKSDFLANMSHEIRTPLNAILGMTRLALRAPMAPAQQVQLGKVIHAANHLLALINDILDFSKIEAGKLTLENVHFALADVLDNVITLVGEKAVDKNLEFITDIEADVPWSLVGDPLRVSQIMVNFANNAIKFTQRGEVVLYVRSLGSRDGRARLRIGVKDTGIGIALEKQATLFQNFVQAEDSNARQYGGTGLGLAITRRLAELMSGQVHVQSIQGVGSDFWCEVEVGYSQPAALPPFPLPSGQRALVVDNHTEARNILMNLLRQFGIQASGAANTEQAVRTLQESATTGTHYDYLLIDRHMPETDGIATAAHIKALRLADNSTPIMLSATPASMLDARAHTAGFVDVLAKPFHAASLRQLLLRLSGASTSSPAAPMVLGTETLRASMGARILLVEDIEINREVARGLLEDLGLELQVDDAENGQIALGMLAERDYDAIFMDMHMPVMDGLAAARAIRNNPAWHDIPIIAMTANNMESDIQNCKDVGMCAFVTKPIDPDHLRNCIRQWVCRRNAPSVAVAAATSLAPPKPQRTLIEVLLENVDGLNPAAGLHSFGGRQATYREMLRRFIGEQEAHWAALHQAAMAGDWAALHTHTQTLASAAKHLGAEKVTDAANQLAVLATPQAHASDWEVPLKALRQRMSLLADGTQRAIPALFTTDT